MLEVLMAKMFCQGKINAKLILIFTLEYAQSKFKFANNCLNRELNDGRLSPSSLIYQELAAKNLNPVDLKNGNYKP